MFKRCHTALALGLCLLLLRPTQADGGEPAAPVAPASAQAAPTLNVHAHGVHGMVLFSDGKTLFASHLPLLHAPHHVQAVLELRAEEPGQQSMLVEAAEHNVLTIEPERFNLFRLRPGHPEPLQGFEAQIYDGHFERAGRPRATARFQVERLRFYHEIVAKTPSPVQHYVAIANADGYFLLHLIQRRGDFDQILRLRGALPAKLNTPMAFGLPGAPALPEASNIVRQIWWETADLAE